MKFNISLFTVIALCFLIAVIYMGWEKAATLHVDQLRPAVGEVGRVVIMKTTVYDQVSGHAKAYVVLQGNKNKRAGYVYDFQSPPNDEHWSIVRRKLLWDEAKGDQPPYITPYWKCQ